jgi:hypothetical protein
MILRSLPLIENTKGIIFDRILFFFNDFPTIQAFPALEINKVIKKGLHYHQALAFWALHSLSLLKIIPDDSP